jgi:hypothetical protein
VQRDESVNARNRLVIQRVGDRLRCVTYFNGEEVHRQWLREEPGSDLPREPASPNQQMNPDGP